MEGGLVVPLQCVTFASLSVMEKKGATMYAVVEIAGQQFKVSANQRLYVHRLEGAEESTVKFDKVLLVDRDGAVTVGSPLLAGASVTAKIVSHVKGDKVIVFKKKRRKGYKVKNGHRQCFTLIEVSGIEA